MKNNLIYLYREYVRCADMCREYNEKHRTNIKTPECVEWKFPSYGWLGCLDGNEPVFNTLLDKEVRFAVAIVEGRPVFVGDTVYDKLLEHPLIVENGDSLIYGTCLRFNELDWDKISWNPPKKRRTFTLNGVELPCPGKEQSEHKVAIHISGSCRPTFPDLRLYFETGGSACDFYNGLRKILLEAKNKE